MHGHTQYDLVTQSHRGYIGVCKCCRQYNFVFQNILVVFTEAELISFLDWLMLHRSAEDNIVELHHGRNRIYSSPYSNLFLAFNDDELEEISTITSELKLMLNIHEILSGK